MNIQRATELALEQNACIIRLNDRWGKEFINFAIYPTNTPDCCIAINFGHDYRKGWQPQADDLMATDWIVVKTKLPF